MLVMAPAATLSGPLAGDAPEPRMLFDAVAEAPFGEAEIDAFLRAAPTASAPAFTSSTSILPMRLKAASACRSYGSG